MQYEDTIDLKRLWLILLRQKTPILGIVLGLFAVAYLYVTYAPKQYTAQTVILLDKSAMGAISSLSPTRQMGFDRAALDSEVEVMRSQRVALEVVRILKDTELPDHFRETPEDDEYVIAGRILEGLEAGREGESYILNIKYTHGDPKVAVALANAYAEAYIADQARALVDLSDRAVEWLRQRTSTLGEQAMEAQKEASQYRVEFNKRQRRLSSGENPHNKKRPLGSSEIGLGKLRTLEKEAETYITLYDSYLKMIETMSTRDAAPVSETRILTYATPLEAKSHPQKILILGAALILGIGMGVFVAIMRDNFDKTLRRAGQVRREIGVPFLGFMPERRKSKNRTLTFASAATHVSVGIAMNAASEENPLSLQTETIRNIRNAIDLNGKGTGSKVIGVLSAAPFAGKAVVASNLALYIAQSSRCLLIDAGVRHADFTLDNKEQAQLEDLGSVIAGEASLQNALLQREGNGLYFLPSFGFESGKTLAHLNAPSAGALIEECRQHFKYIVVDLSPLTSPPDFHSFAQSMDGFVIAAEWGTTLPNALNFHMDQNGIAREKVLGVVLENANMKKMRKYYGHKTRA